MLMRILLFSFLFYKEPRQFQAGALDARCLLSSCLTSVKAFSIAEVVATSIAYSFHKGVHVSVRTAFPLFLNVLRIFESKVREKISWAKQ